MEFKNMENQLVRLNKYVSNSGLCTRREADDYITSGRVYVNNKLVIKLGSKVSIDDEVKVDGKIIFPYDFQYLLLNKPMKISVKGTSTLSKGVFTKTMPIEFETTQKLNLSSVLSGGN